MLVPSKSESILFSEDANHCIFFNPTLEFLGNFDYITSNFIVCLIFADLVEVTLCLKTTNSSENKKIK